MKIILLTIFITISFAFYSCESPTISQSNPLSYGSESPYFFINPYIQYSKIDNRIDYGKIQLIDFDKDSSFVRGAFYNNELFRDAGIFTFDTVNVDKIDAEDLFKIHLLVEGFFEFGVVYFKKNPRIENGKNINVNLTGDEFPAYNSSIKTLDSSLNILNIKELRSISKKEGITIKTNNIGYEESRIRIFNNKKEYLFYTNALGEINLRSNDIDYIPNGTYNLEILKGYYNLDTLVNDELLITNVYSAVVFETSINP